MNEEISNLAPQDGVLRLEELPIRIWLPGHVMTTVKITESPYFVSLDKNDPAAFEAYQDAMSGSSTASSEISWDQFLDLRDDIAANGLRDVGSPIRFCGLGQIDGHHRLAILCHLYGPQTQVQLFKGVVVFPIQPSLLNEIRRHVVRALRFLTASTLR